MLRQYCSIPTQGAMRRKEVLSRGCLNVCLSVFPLHSNRHFKNMSFQLEFWEISNQIFT